MNSGKQGSAKQTEQHNNVTKLKLSKAFGNPSKCYCMSLMKLDNFISISVQHDLCMNPEI